MPRLPPAPLPVQLLGHGGGDLQERRRSRRRAFVAAPVALVALVLASAGALSDVDARTGAVGCVVLVRGGGGGGEAVFVGGGGGLRLCAGALLRAGGGGG